MSTLEATARALVAPGKGILAADESFPTIEKRFKKLQIDSTEENRRAYRDLLLTTPGLNEFISGVILFDETIRQKTQVGKPFPEYLAEQHIIPGIKVDEGTAELPNFPGEKMTHGLDGLKKRLEEYQKLGARFTKWRAVLSIGNGLPSQACLETNARGLALFASLSQEAGLVPIVEPEVLMDGDHDLEACEEVIGRTLSTVFAALFQQRVRLEEMLLKTGMVLPGEKSSGVASTDEIARATRRVLRRTVPPAVPGIVFLSGGQSPEEATERLRAIHRGAEDPWQISFSYGRALQDTPLTTWKGANRNVAAAQSALHKRAGENSAAIRKPMRASA